MFMILCLFLLARGSQSEKYPCIIVPLSADHLSTTGEVELQANCTPGVLLLNNEAEFDTVVGFALQAFNKNVRESVCSEVIGVVGDLDLKTARIIHTLASRANLSVTLVSAVAPSTFLPTTNLALHNLLHMNSLTYYVEALAAFMDYLNWTRVGLISDETHYYEFAAELIQQKLLENPERRITPFVRISERDNRTNIIQTFNAYKTDIVIISTSGEVACSLMKEARIESLIWPEYAWIFIDVSLQPSLEICQEEGVIFLAEQTISENIHVSCYRGRSDFFNSSKFYNSIAAVSLTEGISLFNGTHSGVNGRVKFKEGKRLINISITQNRGGTRFEIAFYTTVLQQLNVLSSFLFNEKPRGTTLVQSYSDFYRTLRLTLVSIIFILMLTFVTIVFILYIYFRKEPEIKATSVTVSLSMFLGCYVLISYLPLLAIDPTVNVHCHLLVWFSLGGIPFPLIIATLLTKMLRVYLIFSNPLSYKKKFFSDPFLILYIVLLMSPNLFILVLWSSYDPLSLSKLMSPQDNSIFEYNRCVCDYTIQWLASQLIYSFSLSFALMCLALKTSKIRYKHFRDTKATNAFTFLSVFIATLTLIYWYFFRLQELKAINLLATSCVLYVGHGSIAMLCQILLFAPKVYPPLKRRLIK